MAYDIQIQELAQIRAVAVVRRRAQLRELPQIVPRACGEVWNVIRSRKISGAGRNIAIYLDDEMNIEVGVEMDGPFAGDGEVVRSSIPAGLVATTAHIGPYQKLPEAHRAVRDWCGRNGKSLAGPNWELYGHWITEWEKDPSKIRTDIFYLLKPDGSFNRGSHRD